MSIWNVENSDNFVSGSREKCLCHTCLTWCFLTMCCSWSTIRAASLNSQHWQLWKELEKSQRILSLPAHSRGKTRGWSLLYYCFSRVFVNCLQHSRIFIDIFACVKFTCLIVTEKTANWLTKEWNIHLIGLSRPHTMALSLDQSPLSPLKRELTWKNSRSRREFCIIKTWPSLRTSSTTTALPCAQSKL